MDETRPESQSIGQLLGAVSGDLRTLAGQTLALGRLELGNTVSALAWSAAGLSLSIVIAIAGLAVLVSALVLIVIALGLPAWAAATLVGLLLTAGGALAAWYFVVVTRRLELTLRETRESVRETLEWLKLQTGR